MRGHCYHHRGFSLIELVIVVVILAIIGAIAIPRLSRGAEGAADSALISDLAVLRNAIDLYTTEHTGQTPAVGAFANQMTRYSDAAGNTNAAKGGAFIYGAYLRSVPPLPVNGVGAGVGVKGDTGVGPVAAVGVAWIYNTATGTIVSNTGTAVDSAGTLYNTY